jgi:multidrug efflux pump subunit AcrA (membrane-fusion protein)
VTTTASEPFLFSRAATPLPFAAASTADPLVDDTRREIAELVREVAVAVRSDRSESDFFALLVDRTQRAMAAEGVVVWRIDGQAIDALNTPVLTNPGNRPAGNDDRKLAVIRRLGRVTDQSIASESQLAHQRLLVEVAGRGEPVVVPATPGATAADVPANPTHVPVALVPIELEPTRDAPAYLLEVFLEPDCGIQTQRGYLRFVAQMADLAGEFLRGNHLRILRQRQQLATAIDDAVVKLHQTDNRQQLEAAIVDGAADNFGFDRVGLCVVNPPRSATRPPRLVAVSHVESVDLRSSAADQIRCAARAELDPDGCRWYVTADSVAADNAGHEMVVRAVVGDTLNSNWRLVCLQVADQQPVWPECRSELIRFVQHASLALDNVDAWESIPAGRLLASWAPRRSRSRRSVLLTLVTWLAIGVVLLLTALFPIPLVVSSPAVIRPEKVQAVTAPRDAIVGQIHVEHGQAVTAGELLVTLTDPDLEQQITTLLGRHAVLWQQKSHWTNALVDTASHQLDRLEQVQSESRLVDEEIQSINDQLAVLRRAEQSLHIRAQQDGQVDAWQITERLQSRPLRRGDWLLQVIAGDSPWTVEAQVPQSRLGHLSRLQSPTADPATQSSVSVSLDSRPTETLAATLVRIGPAVANSTGIPTATAVLLRLDDDAARQVATDHGISHHSGAPARAMFHCGHAPVAYVLFQDLIRSLQANMALYFGGHPRS